MNEQARKDVFEDAKRWLEENIPEFPSAFEGVPHEPSLWRDSNAFYTATAMAEGRAGLTGWELWGMNATKKDGEWLLVLKARKDGHGVVAFVSGHTLSGAYRALASFVRSGGLSWKEDRYFKEKRR